MTKSFILMPKLEIKNEGKVFGFSYWAKDHVNFRNKRKIAHWLL